MLELGSAQSVGDGTYAAVNESFMADSVYLATWRPTPRPITKAIALCLLASSLLRCAGQEGVSLTAAFVFDYSTVGGGPCSTLVQGPDGALYGTDRSGPGAGLGNVYRFTLDGQFTNLAHFYGTNGSNAGEIVLGSDGNIYGLTHDGGVYPGTGGMGLGTVFRLAPDGTLTSLVSFSGTNGCSPYGFLAKGPDDNFYGITASGGIGFDGSSSSGYGTVFRITPQGEFATLVYLGGTNRWGPGYGLLCGQDGYLYGSCKSGLSLSNYDEVLFRMTLGGEMSTVAVVSAAANQHIYGITEGSDGCLYCSGGHYDPVVSSFVAGSIFKVAQNGVVTVLHRFGGNSPPMARRLTEGTDGNFYGVTTGNEVFRITPNGDYTSLGNFTGPNGLSPIVGTIMQASSGDFFGATQQGGVSYAGVIYQLRVPGAEAPRLRAERSSEGSLQFTWIGLPGRSYQLQWKPSFDQGPWGDVGASLIATNKLLKATGVTQGFYRLGLMP